MEPTHDGKNPTHEGGESLNNHAVDWHLGGSSTGGSYGGSSSGGGTISGGSGYDSFGNGGWNDDLGSGSSGTDYGSSAAGVPVVLDLSGQGVKVAPLSSSNFFFDMAGDGYQHRTAWAGAGNGVLVLDLAGNGQITERNQIVFTDWDATATNDLEALLNIFDTNHNGQLDSGDAQFASFKILVTNADGTTTLKTLAEAGVQSINLVPNAVDIILPDGSKIDGQTTFTKLDGSTGVAAAAVFQYDSQGYIIDKFVVLNADGSTTITNSALNPDGSAAHTTIETTSADGNTRTLIFDVNGDGVTDRIQTSVTIANTDGSKTEAMVNMTGAGYLLNQTVTATSADGKIVGIQRDADGDGVNDQTELRTTFADGSTSIVITDLNPDGSIIRSQTAITGADGLSRTTQSDMDGNGSYESSNSDVTVVTSGIRNETLMNSAFDGTLRNKVVTITSANGQTKSIQTDLDGDNAFDYRTDSNVVINANGSSTTTTTEKNGAGTLIVSQAIINLGADGLTRTTQNDIDGNGTFDVTVTNDIDVLANGVRVETTTAQSGDGSLKSFEQFARGSDDQEHSRWTDFNGDGHFDRKIDVTVNAIDGSVTADERIFSPNDIIVQRALTTTSADGLSVATSRDINGDGLYDLTTTSVTVINADGSATTTIADHNRDNSLRDQTITNTSASGLSTTVQVDGNGDGVYEITRADVTVLNLDGSRTETITDRNADVSLRSVTIVATSADRQSVTITRDEDGDGGIDQQETIVTQTTGAVVNALLNYNPDGSLRDQAQSTTSSNGLSHTRQTDVDGDGVFDFVRASTITLNADGSRVEVVANNNANGSLRDKVVTTTSANGFSTTTQVDSNGDQTFELVKTSAVVINSDGSRTTTFTDKNANSGVIDCVVTTVTANGLSSTSLIDLDGNGTVDRQHLKSTVLNANGSRIDTMTDRNGDGSLRNQIVTATSSDLLTVNITRDTNGDGQLDQTETVTTAANGTVSDTIINLNPNGTTRSAGVQTTSADGLSVATLRDINGDGLYDFAESSTIVINVDGSRTTSSQALLGTTLTSARTTTTSDDGLSVTEMLDKDGNGTVDLTTTDELAINNDGSRVQTLTHLAGNGTILDRTVVTISADGMNIHTLGTVGTTGTIKLDQTSQIQSDGSTLVTVDFPNSAQGAPVNTFLTSATGLSTSVLITDGSGYASADFDSVATINNDGSVETVFVN